MRHLKRSKTDVYIQCQQHKLKVSIWKFYQAYCEIVEKIEKERPYSIQLLKILISQDRCHCYEMVLMRACVLTAHVACLLGQDNNSLALFLWNAENG